MATWFRKWLLLILPLLWVVASGHASKKNPAHPFYVSVTEINHNAVEKTLEISCKIFADDMEATLKHNFHTVVDLSNASQQERSGTFISQYVQKRLQLAVGGKPVALKFIGFEKDKESVYCYFEGSGVAVVKKLEIVNSLLHDFTADQINIIHATAEGKRQSTKLNYPASSAVFHF